MKKIALTLTLVLALASFAGAVTDKIGFGAGFNLSNIDPDGFEESGYMAGTEMSVRGIFSNIALELSGSSGNHFNRNDDTHSFASHIGISISYLFDLSQSLALETGLIDSISSTTFSNGDWGHDNGLGLLLGAEYFVNANFGIDARLVALMSSSGSSSDDCKWTNTHVGYGAVGAHLYL